MKVDKGVCTTNDAYFAGTNNSNVNTTQTATNELNSIIKFETVFTTLVENKILAIKRECEQHESKKKSRTFKNILLRKSNQASTPAIETATTTTPLTPTAPLTDSSLGQQQINEDVPKETDTNRCKKDGKNFFFKYRKRPTKDDVEKGNAKPDNEQFKEVPSKINDDDELVNVIVVPNESINQQVDKDVADAKLDSQSNELVIAADVDARNLFNLPVSNAKLITDDKQNNCDKLIINSHTTENNNAQLTPSTTKSNNNCNVKNVTSSVQQQAEKEVENLELAAATTTTTTINNENDESLATTIDISLQQSSIVVLSKEHAGELPINNQINNNSSNNNNVNDKSDVAICDDGLSSQNTSDIEFSLVSENSITDLPEKLRKKVTAGVVAAAATTTVTNSDPIIKKSVNVISPPLTRHDKKPCERKAKSCQSTPIFGRHKHVRSESEGKKILTFQRELPTKKYETKITDAVKSETIVIAPASTSAAIATITTTTLASKSMPPAVSSGPLESVHMTTTKKIQKHSSKHRDVSIEYEITYDDDNENQSPHGFISSFNQLTSQKQPAAIISANLKKQTSKQVKGQQGKDSIKNQHETEKTVTNQEVELELDELNVDVVNKKKRRRSKYNGKLWLEDYWKSGEGR